MLIGFWTAGLVSDRYLIAGTHDWQSIWQVPAALAALMAIGFALAFRNENVSYEQT
jgi:hypothetical protein